METVAPIVPPDWTIQPTSAEAAEVNTISPSDNDVRVTAILDSNDLDIGAPFT